MAVIAVAGLRPEVVHICAALTLAAWLQQRHLDSGLAPYWEASSVIVESGGKVTMPAIGIHGWNHQLAPDEWETDVLLASPVDYPADFVVAGPDEIVPVNLAQEMSGYPVKTQCREVRRRQRATRPRRRWESTAHPMIMKTFGRVKTFRVIAAKSFHGTKSSRDETEGRYRRTRATRAYRAPANFTALR